MRNGFRVLAILMLTGATAMMLGGCGRKGPLDPPPGASADLPQDAAKPAAPGGVPSVFGTSDNSRQEIVAPRKRIPIDALLE